MKNLEKKTVSTNRKAFHNYEILENYEAGIMLEGYEVKSLRQGKANLQDGFVRLDKGQAFIENIDISAYSKQSSHIIDYNPRHKRKLLLHKNEIHRLDKKVREKGLTIVPLELYFNKRGIAKLAIGLAKGKRVIDKKETIQRRDMDRDMAREMRSRK